MSIRSRSFVRRSAKPVSLRVARRSSGELLRSLLLLLWKEVGCGVLLEGVLAWEVMWTVRLKLVPCTVVWLGDAASTDPELRHAGF